MLQLDRQTGTQGRFPFNCSIKIDGLKRHFSKKETNTSFKAEPSSLDLQLQHQPYHIYGLQQKVFHYFNYAQGVFIKICLILQFNETYPSCMQKTSSFLQRSSVTSIGWPFSELPIAVQCWRGRGLKILKIREKTQHLMNTLYIYTYLALCPVKKFWTACLRIHAREDTLIILFLKIKIENSQDIRDDLSLIKGFGWSFDA